MPSTNNRNRLSMSVKAIIWFLNSSRVFVSPNYNLSMELTRNSDETYSSYDKSMVLTNKSYNLYNPDDQEDGDSELIVWGQ